MSSAEVSRVVLVEKPKYSFISSVFQTMSYGINCYNGRHVQLLKCRFTQICKKLKRLQSSPRYQLLIHVYDTDVHGTKTHTELGGNVS